MRSDLVVVVRDAVDLFYDKSPQYKTQVQDILDDGTVLVGIPTYLGVAMPVRKGQKMSMAFYRDTGMYVVDVKVKGFTDKGGLKFAALVITSKPVKEQRRNYFRLPVLLKTHVCVCPEDVIENRALQDGPIDDEVIETVKTNNISISGISIKTKRLYSIGEKYLLKVHLEWPRESAPPVILFAEVKRVSENPADEIYHVGMHFFDSDENTREHVAKYILTQQQKQIKQRRLIEGE